MYGLLEKNLAVMEKLNHGVCLLDALRMAGVLWPLFSLLFCQILALLKLKNSAPRVVCNKDDATTENPSPTSPANDCEDDPENVPDSSRGVPGLKLCFVCHYVYVWAYGR